MADANVNLSNLFADLKKIEQNGEYERGLKITDKILKLSPNHEKALHCKLVCLIQVSQFEEALKLFDQLNETLKASLSFEKSYCEYRLNKVDEALKTLKNADQENLAVRELKNQALYRIEQFQDCYDDYVDLIKNSDDDYEDERYVNLAAVISGLVHLNKNFKHDFLDVNENTYEILYNKACILISQNEYGTALKKLNEAELMCRKYFEEDGASEEEIEVELAIIRAQIAFCMQKMNKKDTALKTYNQILRQKLSDLALIAVVSNNIIAIHKDQNLFDSKKKIKMAMNENVEFKLSTTQKEKIFFNCCLFLANTNQTDAFRKQLANFKEKFPKLNDILLIEAYSLMKEKNVQQAVKILADFCSKRKIYTENDLKLVLLLVQLLMNDQKYADAAKFLEGLGDLKYYPVIVSILNMLYEKCNNVKAIENLFKSAINWHEANESPTSILSVLHREAAKFYLNQNQPRNSVVFLEKLIQIKGKNPKIISMLINAYSQFDMNKAQKFQNELPSIEEILASVDIDHLENKNWSLGVKYVKKSKDTPKVAAEKKAKKKPRKKILPKNYNPNEQPDPERWLPKYERSNYRKKKDKKGVGKGTQGAVGEMEAKPSPKPVVPSPPGPRQQRPTQKKKKKARK